MDFARGIAEKITQVVMNYSDVEIKVREATNDDPWGPSGSLMQELAYQTKRYEGYADVVCMLWRRMLQDNKNNWRRVYKSLILLSYLLRHGSDKVVVSAFEHLYDMKFLKNYSYIDDRGKDRGACVRQKVKDIISLLEDKERLHNEREAAQKNKNKFIGISRELSENYVDSYDSNNNEDKWQSRSSYGEDWQADEYEYKDYDDDDDDDDVTKYRGTNQGSPSVEEKRNRVGGSKAADEKRIDNYGDDDADDDFDPRKTEGLGTNSKDDDGFGDFAQYVPIGTKNDNANVHQSKDMLTFDPLDSIQTTTTTTSPNNNNNYKNNLSNDLMNNSFSTQTINLGSNNVPLTNQVPFLTMPQSNAMMRPLPSPPLGLYPGGMSPTNQPLQTFPIANQGCYYYNYQPIVRFGQQFMGPVNFQAQPLGSPQNVLHSANLFQANQKSLI